MTIVDGVIRWARSHIEGEGELLLTLFFVLPPYLVIHNLLVAVGANESYRGASSTLFVLLVVASLLTRRRSRRERFLLFWFTSYMSLLVALAIALLPPLFTDVREGGPVHMDPTAWVAVGTSLVVVVLLQVQYGQARAPGPSEG